MATPTLIGMPEPPSNPDTPTEMPGTPNSTTTSLSCLSTTAIKDGHRGQAFAHSGFGHHTSSNTLEAERADRISRLAGLERVSAARPAPNNQAQFTSAGGAGGAQIPGYFDQNGNPVYTTKMSTVGSASATGSVGGGNTTTWASGSTKGADDDEMSMDTNFRDIDERDRYSASAVDDQDDGMSDDTSLVGFGEGAGSTMSGPTYSRREGALARGLLQRDESFGGTPVSDRPSAAAEQQGARGPNATGVETAERIMRDRLAGGTGPSLGTPEEAGLGKFYFEEKK